MFLLDWRLVILSLQEQMNEGKRLLNATFVLRLPCLPDSWGSSIHSARQTYLWMNWFSSKYWQPLAMSLATLRRSTMVRLDGWSWSIRTETEEDSGFNVSQYVCNYSQIRFKISAWDLKRAQLFPSGGKSILKHIFLNVSTKKTCTQHFIECNCNLSADGKQDYVMWGFVKIK